jgi:HPt (histidine-containing phosphotransfer) domain-containing protein
VRRIGGKVDAYVRQLKRFRERYSDAVHELQRQITYRGMQQAEDYCHALKGVSGNIGAQSLFECITQIDAELKLGQMPQPGQFSRMSELLQAVMRDIDSLPKATTAMPVAGAPPAAPLSARQVREKIARLAEVLENDIGAAEAALTELRSGVTGSALEPAINEIAAKIDNFAIDDALELLARLRGQLANPV